MRPVHDGGGRAAIVLNGSPLFNGAAESGPSEIRRWLLENDLVDAIVALPTNMFFNTGIATYIWVLDNTKPAERIGKVQLIDGTSFCTKMRKNLGAKSREITDADRRRRSWSCTPTIAETDDYSKIFTTDDFGYWTITVERPLLDEAGKPVTDRKGNPKPDAKKRDTENVPFTYGGNDRGADGSDAGDQGLLRDRGAAARPRRLDRPRKDQDRLRDPLHPALLQVRPAPAAGGDRRRPEQDGRRDPRPAAGGGAVTLTPSYRRVGATQTFDRRPAGTRRRRWPSSATAAFDHGARSRHRVMRSSTDVYPDESVADDLQLRRRRRRRASSSATPWSLSSRRSERLARRSTAVVGKCRRTISGLSSSMIRRRDAYALLLLHSGRRCRLIDAATMATSTASTSVATESDRSHADVPVPPLDEQRAIADYLDRETAQIDTLIAKQERLIETLRERGRRVSIRTRGSVSTRASRAADASSIGRLARSVRLFAAMGSAFRRDIVQT